MVQGVQHPTGGQAVSLARGPCPYLVTSPYQDSGAPDGSRACRGGVGPRVSFAPAPTAQWMAMVVKRTEASGGSSSPVMRRSPWDQSCGLLAAVPRREGRRRIERLASQA